MGLFDAAAQGLSTAGYAAGDLYAKSALMDQKSDLDVKEAQLLAQFKVDLETKTANQQREAQVSRIDAKAGQLAGQQVDAKYGDIAARTPDEQDRLNATKSTEDTTSMISNPKLRTQAAIQTGDISPKDAATLQQRGDADMTKLMLGEQRTQTMALIAAGHDETRQMVASIAAASKKDSSNKEDRVIVHQFLGQFDRKMTENGKEIRSLRSSLGSVLKSSEKQPILDQIEELQAENTRLSAAQLDYAKQAGIQVPTVDPGADAPTPGPAPSPSAAKKPPLGSFLHN